MLGVDPLNDFVTNARPAAQAGKVDLFHPVTFADVVDQVIRSAAFAYERHRAIPKFPNPGAEIPPQFSLPHYPKPACKRPHSAVVAYSPLHLAWMQAGNFCCLHNNFFSDSIRQGFQVGKPGGG
jgi:hypothetical protein